MGAIQNDWLLALQGEFRQPYYKKLFQTVNEEYRTRKIFPPSDDIFNAFHLTPLKDVKVVILGQDPYHGDGQAHGLCFSVRPGVDIPPSLVNIYKELHDDLGCTIPNHGRCGDPPGRQTGPASRVYPVGKTGTDEAGDAAQSKTSDPGGAASKPAFRIQGFFRKQTVQSGKSFSGSPGSSADRLADRSDRIVIKGV